MSYVGRFAPSPSGDLHIGTLTAAVASFLHARQANGKWLVRIEDIDPPREVPGSADTILRTLEALDLHWDDAVAYQSHRVPVYLECAEALVRSGHGYYCTCSRRQVLQETGGSAYPGTCRGLNRPKHDAAIRLQLDSETVEFVDGIQGRVVRNIQSEDGDFVIVRRDGLPAYHLAVVIDDAEQGITDIVRGVDLLASTPLHIELQRQLGLGTPRYWHIPLIANARGDKLSKSAGSRSIDLRRTSAEAGLVLELLGLTPPGELAGAAPATLWAWALENWQIEALSRQPEAVRLAD